jgi:carbon monoxide dehydrogenase subunit G
MVDQLEDGKLDMLERASNVWMKVTRGDIFLSNVEPAKSYRLSGQGRGGILGMAKGFADITLNDHPDGSTLDFEAMGDVSGSVEKIGAKLVSGAAQSVIDRFFERFAAQFGATAVPYETE